jgi:hypothetical protein
MKTLKIVAALLFFLGFASNDAKSQKPVSEVYDFYFVLPFDCMNQNLTGTLTVEKTYINNHLQIRHSGTLTGESDGLKYYADMMTNIEDKANWDEWGQQAITQTWPANYHISRDGKLIAIIHFSYHYTVNANGEWASYHGDTFECNLVGEGRFK